MKRTILLIALFPIALYAQIPSYYQNINFETSGEQIKNQLAQLITDTHTTQLVYTSGSSGLLDTWTVLRQSDLNPANQSNVLLIYGWNDSSATTTEHRSRDVTLSCHTSSCAGKWVREHVFPRSLGTPDLGSEFAGADAHNLRAIDAQRNNTRSNRLFTSAPANVASFSVSSNTWYPGDEWVGDVARIIMYMYLRYPTQCNPIAVATGSTTHAPLNDMPDILLQWNAQDPPSDFEVQRNNAIATAQGNRNPFIDNPYLATLIWNGPSTTDSWNALHTNKTIQPEFTLYPTATEDVVYVQNATENLTYEVFNTGGQKVKHGKLENSIDVSALSKGMYIIKIHGQQNTFTKKIIVM